MRKVQLILVDGMRPDALLQCSNPYARQLLDESLYTLKAQTVTPSVTLPCHMSLFHSVDPGRHGITTNFFMPQVRPVDGLCERLKGKKRCGMFFNWEELRDLTRPGSLTSSFFSGGSTHGYEEANERVTDAAIRSIREDELDFAFIYLGWTDEAGHAEGWMGQEYLRSVDKSLDCIHRLIDAAPQDCVTIVIADHGGHERSHGTELAEDMTIPVIIHGAGAVGEMTGSVSIKDIAPTIVRLLDCEGAPEWEGRMLL